MHFLSKQLSKYDYRYLIELLGLIFVTLVLSSPSLVLADTTDTVTEADDINWLDYDKTIIEDADLSLINGKGASSAADLDAAGLKGDSKLAIILWDEGGQNNKRGTNHELNSIPVIHLTVTHQQ